MKPGRYNLNLTRGDTFALMLAYKAGGLPVDLTGATVRMRLVNPSDGAFVHEATTANEQIAITQAEGRIDIQIPSHVTALWPARQLSYDLEVTFPGGRVSTLMAGKLQVTQDVTR